MSRRSANFSRFAGTSSAPLASTGDTSPFPLVADDQSYPLRPLSRNRLSNTRPQERSGNGGHNILGQSKKSRLSDGEPPDNGYDRAGAGDGSEEQDLLLLGSAGVEGAWPHDHHMPLETVDENWQPRLSITESAIRTLSSKHGPSMSSRSRTIPFGAGSKFNPSIYPPNVIRNQKYSIISFLPLVFYEQFKFFFNLYFLLVALSQFVPALKIGFIATYVAPLAFVLSVTMGKEAYDDYQRHLRDREANSLKYLVLDRGSRFDSVDDDVEAYFGSALTKSISAAKIKAGDLVLLEKNARVPADMLLLRTSESGLAAQQRTPKRNNSTLPSDMNELVDANDTGRAPIVNSLTDLVPRPATGDEEEGGSCFVRTDQLDGETDWKLKVAVAKTQKCSNRELLSLKGELYADAPIKDIHTFVGNLTISSSSSSQPDIVPLNVENVLWANTVLAAGSAVGMVVYTGKETRAAMNTSEPETKTGLLDLEINRMAKWFIYVFRFLILFSSIIPISLRVNLDMGKTVYAHQIQNDAQIAGTIVRTSTLPEELGRIEYLLSDKTGTLTQNEMEMRKLHMGTMSYGWDAMDEISRQVGLAFSTSSNSGKRQSSMSGGISTMTGRGRRDMSSRVRDAVLALAVCHNVTPVQNDDGSVTYQASSPDEVAIVQWTESVGITLIARDRKQMTLRDPTGGLHVYLILAVFPFTSESKRMGIIVREAATGEVTFVQKGADVVMSAIVQKNDWLDEECGNMAREGLRTLVIGRKRLSEDAYRRFDKRYKEAQVNISDRNNALSDVIATELELELDLLALTGVEDKLQEDVKPTLEVLRNAGLKIWMLTGDKIETATCIAMSSKLVARGQYIHQVAKCSYSVLYVEFRQTLTRSLAISETVKTNQQVLDMLDFVRTKLDCCLVIDGESLQLCLERHQYSFIEIATQLPVVVACRCSPTQKADVAKLIREYTKKRVCCIGDGGNDVSMIQAADVGVGIVGKEGKQASLAADFSINQFSFLTKLLLWHGRNSYKRSAKLAQFVIHRGLIISVIQAVFSSIFFFAPIAVYQGWLQVGYATLYTMAPVFSLVLDKDVSEDLALMYPELYKELTKGRTLSSKTFFEWLTISVYQGKWRCNQSDIAEQNLYLPVGPQEASL
ncbi:hypothetical protein QFC22_000765 [Naganishia vaughanmartiniae]|uniref:Uncharacterized protein n=1 Tax=Naganishia vaughanmartiniae TaxID=1424756 RepID=A0ACC2XKS6_9TREE|nr:hypothetical protein QFC22_000765 [Naganishia vaughanmartiniae]